MLGSAFAERAIVSIGDNSRLPKCSKISASGVGSYLETHSEAKIQYGLRQYIEYGADRPITSVYSHSSAVSLRLMLFNTEDRSRRGVVVLNDV